MAVGDSVPSVSGSDEEEWKEAHSCGTSSAGCGRSDRSIDLSDLFVSKENMTEHLLVLEQLREVNPTWYQVIVFSTVYDLDNNTIGELLGQKPELISKWKSRGRAWLRKRYKEQYPNG